MLPRRLDVEKKLLLVGKSDFFKFDAKPVPDMGLHVVEPRPYAQAKSWILTGPTMPEPSPFACLIIAYLAGSSAQVFESNDPHPQKSQID